jgi:hypothetical protein
LTKAGTKKIVYKKANTPWMDELSTKRIITNACAYMYVGRKREKIKIATAVYRLPLTGALPLPLLFAGAFFFLLLSSSSSSVPEPPPFASARLRSAIRDFSTNETAMHERVTYIWQPWLLAHPNPRLHYPHHRSRTRYRFRQSWHRYSHSRLSFLQWQARPSRLRNRIRIEIRLSCRSI